jgi:ribosomal protein S18 acetylase RimI-like enzyme
MEIKALGPGDEDQVKAVSHLFDQASDADATRCFLGEHGHHLLVAYEDGHPRGFVSGIKMTHPDKGTEMFLYNLAVQSEFRRRGFGRALVDRLTAMAKERGCYGMWVVTGAENEAALATYESSGSTAEPGQVVLVWTF